MHDQWQQAVGEVGLDRMDRGADQTLFFVGRPRDVELARIVRVDDLRPEAIAGE